MKFTSKMVMDLYLGKYKPMKEQCPECNRVFDLADIIEADEFYHGHDCEWRAH